MAALLKLLLEATLVYKPLILKKYGNPLETTFEDYPSLSSRVWLPFVS
jgi:hypothetical protein